MSTPWVLINVMIKKNGDKLTSIVQFKMYIWNGWVELQVENNITRSARLKKLRYDRKVKRSNVLTNKSFYDVYLIALQVRYDR